MGVSSSERQYLAQLENALSGTSLSEKERREILLEIENHFVEAHAAGAESTELTRKLGSAHDLARAYAAELVKAPFDAPQMRWTRWLFRAGALLSGCVVTVLLGAAGVAMLTAGVFAVGYGLVGPLLPPAWDVVLRAGLPQVVLVCAGGMVAVVGFILLRVLFLNLSILLATFAGFKRTP